MRMPLPHKSSRIAGTLIGALLVAVAWGAPGAARDAPDKHARVKVQFPFDRESSPGRGAPSARFGAQLRVGVLADGTLAVEDARGRMQAQHRESDLDFIARLAEEGPNRPVVVGRLFNPEGGEQRVIVEQVTLTYQKIEKDAGSGPGERSVVVVQRGTAAGPCESPRRCPATSEITTPDGSVQAGNGWFVTSPVITLRGEDPPARGAPDRR